MKEKYRVHNWSEYNAGLKKRVSLTFWLNEEVLETWLIQEKTGKRGASPQYSVTAIATVMTIRSVFHLGAALLNRRVRFS